MPSRVAVAVILLLWLAVMGYVARREVLPRYFADDPPRIDFVLVDELSTANTIWVIYRGDERIGGMTSRTEHLPADDTFRFTNTYRGLKFDFPLLQKLIQLPLGFEIPTATTFIRVSRDGQLREQGMTGTFDAVLLRQKVASATAEVVGRVEGDQLVGRSELKLDGFLDKPLAEDLIPVPVTAGRVMNPLMPVDRLAGVVPGKRWSARHSDPLFESMYLLMVKVFKDKGVNTRLLPGATDSPELLAEVLADPEALDRKDGPVSCWVIRYESADKSITAKTYVRRDDGRVMRQEASRSGERLRFERDE